MIFVSNNWKMWAAGMVVSLGIFLVLFFTVIKPSSDNANNAVKQGLQQSQQLEKAAQQQINQAASSAASAPSSSSASNVTKAATSQASKALSNAQKLTACLQAAGTNVSAASACTTKYAG